MSSEGSRPEYISYLLRMWREARTHERDPTWRASVVSTLTGKRRGFANLDDLFDFLRQQQESAPLDGNQNHRREQAPGTQDATEG